MTFSLLIFIPSSRKLTTCHAGTHLNCGGKGHPREASYVKMKPSPPVVGDSASCPVTADKKRRQDSLVSWNKGIDELSSPREKKEGVVNIKMARPSVV